MSNPYREAFGPRANLKERISQRLKQSGDCLIWTGTSGNCGGVRYGRIRIHNRLKVVHRVAWELANGVIPSGMEVGRHCRQSLCCNVDHMFLFPQKKSEAWLVALQSENRSA